MAIRVRRLVMRPIRSSRVNIQRLRTAQLEDDDGAGGTGSDDEPAARRRGGLPRDVQPEAGRAAAAGAPRQYRWVVETGAAVGNSDPRAAAVTGGDRDAEAGALRGVGEDVAEQGVDGGAEVGGAGPHRQRAGRQLDGQGPALVL